MNPTPYQIGCASSRSDKVDGFDERSEEEIFVARKGRTSIVREVKESLDAIDKIGQSKRDARATGTSGIHSIKQKQNTMSDAQNFVKWVRAEHGVLSISDLNEGHYRSYIAHMQDKGLSSGHIRNVETSLKLLEKGFQERSERFGEGVRPSASFCPSKRLVRYQEGENAQNRSYSQAEIEKIKENCSPEVNKAIDLMQNLGLRVREAANIRVEHFVPTPQGWVVEIKKGAGITKGGRHRDIPVPKNFEKQLEQLLVNKRPEDSVVKVAESTIRDGINVACKKSGVIQGGRGAHGFRHAYARQRMDQLATTDQRQMMVRILDNREMGRNADYGILSHEDKSLYADTKAVMDKIHEELGHGADRWELAMRYLRE